MHGMRYLRKKCVRKLDHPLHNLLNEHPYCPVLTPMTSSPIVCWQATYIGDVVVSLGCELSSKTGLVLQQTPRPLKFTALNRAVSMGAKFVHRMMAEAPPALAPYWG